MRRVAYAICYFWRSTICKGYADGEYRYIAKYKVKVDNKWCAWQPTEIDEWQLACNGESLMYSLTEYVD